MRDDAAADAYDNIIEGRRAVAEALKAGRAIDKLYIAKGSSGHELGFLAASAREVGVVVVETDARKLDGMSATRAHQGIIAVAAVMDYAQPDDILAIAAEGGHAPLVVMCDGISDPHNLGAIIRTADAAGAHGVIIPKRRSASVGAVAMKASAGAASHVAVARVPNLAAAARDMKAAGLWLFAASPEGDTGLWDADFARPAAIVIGSEGSGVGRLMGEMCDYTVGIPMMGAIQSLNASVAAAVMLYEAARQRGYGTAGRR